MAALLLSHSMAAPLDHDEHQFVAAGALLARRSLLPYRDFPYFHTPNLVFVYAGLFRRTHYLLLGARLVSTACGAITVAITSLVTYHILAGWLRGLATAAATLLLLVSPLFLYADGLAWNHDAAEMLLLAAAALFLREISRGYRPGPLVLCGALLGLAIGTRLTVAPAVAAFAGILAADPRRRPAARIAPLATFAAGTLLALGPSLWLLGAAPGGFVFGNFQYATLNTVWRQASAHGRDTSPVGKLLEFAAVLLKPADLLLLGIGCVTVACVRNRANRSSNHPNRMHLTFLGLLALFLLVGSFAPSPTFAVYFYAPVPLVIWWCAYALAPLDVWKRKPAKILVALTLAACAVLGAGAYADLPLLAHPTRWVPCRVHSTGQALRASTGAGRALTLAPIYPMEGGLDIYEAYATGPFAVRVADFVPRETRQRLRLAGTGDLPRLLRRSPPVVVVVGFEGELEWPLIQAGERVGSSVVRLRKTPDSGRLLIIGEDPSTTTRRSSPVTR